jgi:beta-glucosidase
VEITQTRPLYLNPTCPVSTRAQDLLARLTVDEKIAQMTSVWFKDMQVGQEFSSAKMAALLANGIGQVTRIGGSSALSPIDVARAGNAIQRFLMNDLRLGIPAILHEESCVGYLTLGGTIFPQIIGLASTWCPELAGQMAAEIRRQMLAVGARQALAPVLDISRDPRWGRTEETFGEDPLLVAQFGMAYIRGLQGADLSAGVIATGKHFVGHSLSAGGLNCAPAQTGPNALWDVYLMPFQGAIRDAGLRSIMNAYPELDGIVAAASPSLLDGLLRRELGFEGLVVSDYYAIPMIHTLHRATPDLRAAAVKALKAGIDQELPAQACYGEPLRLALEAGEISMDEIDLAVRRILEAKFGLGLFENPYVDEGNVLGVFETPSQRSLAREIARQSLILLKNEGGLLPLTPRAFPDGRLDRQPTIAVIGPNAAQPRNLLGDYSYPAMLELMRLAPAPGSAPIAGVDDAHVLCHSVSVPSVLEQIQAHAGPETRVLYAPGCSVSGADRSGFDQAVSLAAQADVVILVLGDKSGLVPDCTSGETRDRAVLGLPGVQENLAKAVVAVGKPVVAVLVTGRPLSITWLDENVPAILEAWLPGEEGAAAIAEALFGETNPGGKLPITFPRTVGQVPIYYSHKPSGGRSYWYGDYVDTPASPLYPFGHGLSYTTFSYSDLQISPKAAASGESVEVSLSIANTGDVAGDEVVQLYVCDQYASLPRPVKELKGFCRLTLAPGERRRLAFQLPVDLLAYYDEELKLIVEAGQIDVFAGSSSQDIRLQGEFQITGPARTVVHRRLFACPVAVR